MSVAQTVESTSLSASERATLERFAERLRAELGDEVVAVWLYGSRARGEPSKPESDVDVLVITRRGREDWDRAYRILTEAAEREGASPAFFSLKVYDPPWLADRRRVDAFFLREVDRDKVVLAGQA